MSAIAHIVQPPQPAPCWPAEQVRRHSIEVPEDTKRSQPPRAVPVEPKPPKAAPVKAAPVKAKPARARKPRKMAGLSPRQAQALELLAESGCAKRVAEAMGISAQRVSQLLATATKRLGTTTRWETIMAWKDAQC
jgi:DNA-binding CsgD family transcriptional regulator